MESVSLEYTDTTGGQDQYRIAVKFKTKLKSNHGTLYAVIKSAPYAIPLHRYEDKTGQPDQGTPPPGAGEVREGEDTNWFTVRYTQAGIPVTPAEFENALINQPQGKQVEVVIDDYPPTVPDTNQLIKNLDNNVQLLRIQGQKQ